MKLLTAILLFLVLLLTGCSVPKQVSPGEFEERYGEVGQAATMRHVTYLGRQDGRAFIRISTMSRVSRKWSDHLIVVDLDALDPAFRDSLPDHEYKPRTSP